MFRKLLALEVAALSSSEESSSRPERDQTELLNSAREVFTPRTGNYGSMWSKRSFG